MQHLDCLKLVFLCKLGQKYGKLCNIYSKNVYKLTSTSFAVNAQSVPRITSAVKASINIVTDVLTPISLKFTLINIYEKNRR